MGARPLGLPPKLALDKALVESGCRDLQCKTQAESCGLRGGNCPIESESDSDRLSENCATDTRMRRSSRASLKYESVTMRWHSNT